MKWCGDGDLCIKGNMWKMFQVPQPCFEICILHPVDSFDFHSFVF